MLLEQFIKMARLTAIKSKYGLKQISYTALQEPRVMHRKRSSLLNDQYLTH